MAIAWAPLLWRLGRMWGSETEQLYGHGVPVLVAWLLWRRRGEWACARAGRSSRGAAALAAGGGVLMAAGVLALEANPLWPRAAWLAAAGALAMSCGVVARAHGLAAARAVAPVLALMLTALKWPAFVHEPVMGWLMRTNAMIAAELSSLFGAPAVVAGNVIEVAGGLVGVDEACSGLRSLQTVVMMAFFLGEQQRMRAGRRLVLLAGSVVAAMAANVVRTAVLTWLFANRGVEAEERWHDFAGLAALVLTVLCVWLLAERLSGDDAGGGRRDAIRATGGFRWRPWAAACAGALAIEAGTQAWYLAHEDGATERASWRLAPSGASGWGRIGVPERTAEILRYESGEAFARELPAPPRQMLAFVFRWSADLARLGMPEAHDPRICLPAVGATEEAELPEARVTVDGEEIPFRFLRFRQGRTTQHVWVCLWTSRGGDAALGQGGDITERRWRRVLAGVRDEEREQLIFFVQGAPDDASAAETLRDAVLTSLRRR